MPEQPTATREDPVVPEQHTDRFAWRAHLRRNPVLNTTYRAVIAVVGLAVVVVGIIALPLPGPGWGIIFVGIGLWATEFAWARRLLHWTKEKVLAWARWMQHQPWWMQSLVTLGIIVLVLLIFWVLFLISGVPSIFPDWATDLLGYVPGL